MSTDRFVQDSIEDTLLALATGLREAQEALNESPPLDAYGRPLPSYQIPWLDFEINTRIETVRQSDGRTIFRVALSKPAGGSSSSSTQSLDSKLSGRFVAVPPGDGMPVARLLVTAQQAEGDGRTLRIGIQLGNSAGELLADRRVEVNIDPGASHALSAVNNVAFDRPQGGTLLAEAVLVTGADGTASTLLSIDPKEPAGAIIVVTAQAGAAKASTSIPAARP